MLLREGDTVGKSEIAIVVARQENLPAVSSQQSLDPARPVESELLFPVAAQSAFGAGVLATVARIQNQDGLRVRAWRPTVLRIAT